MTLNELVVGCRRFLTSLSRHKVLGSFLERLSGSLSRDDEAMG